MDLTVAAIVGILNLAWLALYGTVSSLVISIIVYKYAKRAFLALN